MSDPNLQSSQYVPNHQDGSGLHVLSEAATAILANKRHSTPVLIERATSERPFSGSLSTSDMSSDPSINLKRNSTPPSLVVDDESSDQAMSDLSSSSSSHRIPEQSLNGFSVAQLMLKRDRSVSSTSLTYRGSPYDHRNDVKRSSDLASAVIESHHYYANNHESDDDDQPLDMSIKSKNSSLVAGRSLFPASAHDRHQQLRPSVIQCVPRTSLVPSPEIPSPEIPSSRPPSFSYLNYGDQSRSRCSKKAEHSISERASKLRILSGPGDDNDDGSPTLDIDEHFRRSLGNKYPQILNKQQITDKTADTTEVPEVDDHFAKALGPTWYKLNKNGEKETAETSASNKAQGVTS